jgi:hypothetical protein
LRLATLALLALFPPALAAAQEPSASDDWRVCAAAGSAAERRFGIPEGLLHAIGLVESGRSGPAGTAPWPWAIDADGQSMFAADRGAAVAMVAARQAAGTASIDVGCFQVNLLHHPDAFESLEQAFDPDANAAYAARFLAALHDRTGSWEDAVAAYHSAAPERGLPYRDRVLAAWSGSGLPEPVVAFGVRVITPAPAGAAPRVISLQPVSGIAVWAPGRR